MAVATFRFHGDLALFLARGRRDRAFEHACARAATIKHAIEALGVPHTEAGRLTVNGEPATLARIVREGDAIEVFPRGVQEEEGAREFVADAHLGGLARLLRMLGFDTLYDNRLSDRDILAIVRREPRIVLTRDRELLKCREIARGCFVRAVKPEPQLAEVAARYGLARRMRPFTRCLHCNLPLEALGRQAAAQRVPQSIAERYREFSRCPGCQRIYWQGSHWERMRALLAAALATPLPG
ncbi:MAG TPA: Mut7-C RNAse domain-containing protein [Burkholderiales bacterium]|nr:Mut7-C RNAse domain-containing protein [Burkholderiales bacterium]